MNNTTVFIFGLICGVLLCIFNFSRYKISTVKYKDEPVFYKIDRITGQIYMTTIMGKWNPIDESENVHDTRTLIATTISFLTIPFLLWIWLKKKGDDQSNTSQTWKSRIRKVTEAMITIILAIAFNLYLWILHH